MKRLVFVVVVGLLALVVGAAYRVHHTSVQPTAVSHAISQPAHDGKSTVTPDTSFVDFFDALDRQWNAESKQRVLAVSPTGDTRKAPSTNPVNKEKE
jgi:hypothetical protein